MGNIASQTERKKTLRPVKKPLDARQQAAEAASSPESSVSGSVYQDTASRLSSPEQATDDSSTLKADTSPGGASDVTVLCGATVQSCPGTPDEKISWRRSSEPLNRYSASTISVPTFTLTQHKKVVLPPIPYTGKWSADDPLRPSSLYVSIEGVRTMGHRRHSSYDVPPTCARPHPVGRIYRPTFVPEKLDYGLRQKFEGHVLINWLCVSCKEEWSPSYLLNQQDLRILVSQFCSCLLAAGVMRQIETETSPLDTVFRAEFTYCWSLPPSTGQQSRALSSVSWTSVSDSLANYRSMDIDFQTMISGLQKEHSEKIQRLQKEQEISLFHLRGEQAARLNEYEDKICYLEREVDKYQTLAGIAELARKAKHDLDSTPTSPTEFFPPMESSVVSTQTEMVHTSSSHTQTITTKKCSVEIQTEEMASSSVAPDLVSHLGERTPIAQAGDSTPPLPSPPCLPVPASPHFPVGVTPSPPPLPSVSGNERGENGSEPVLPAKDGNNAQLPTSSISEQPIVPSDSGIETVPLPTKSGSEPLISGSEGGHSPPLPPPPPMPAGELPSTSSPLPPPPPPPTPPGPAVVSSPRSNVRKQPVSPKVPMKPLYWTRILLPPNLTESCVWEGMEEKSSVVLDEFVDLFSKHTTEKIKTGHRKRQRVKGKETVRLLEQKRWQNIDLIISSLHLQVADIENVVYNIDTTSVNLQSLQALYDIRATAEELETIKAHLGTRTNVQLDRPEQFLYELSQIPDYTDRLSCVMYQITFGDYIGQVESKLTNFKATCELLLTSHSIQSVLSIILTLGNYMNGGSKSRGQADGFGLEILSRLKDVKSKDNTTTLLHYVVKIYVRLLIKEINVDTLKLPTPEPNDVERASMMHFEETTTELKRIHSQMKACEQRVEKISRCSEEGHHQVFGNKMTEFLKKAHQEYKEQKDILEECIHRIHALKTYYCWQPRSTKPFDWPKEYFTLWIQFCYDFKDIWTKEIQRRTKDEWVRTRKKGRDKHGTGKGKGTPQKSKSKKCKASKDSPPTTETHSAKQDQTN